MEYAAYGITYHRNILSQASAQTWETIDIIMCPGGKDKARSNWLI